MCPQAIARALARIHWLLGEVAISGGTYAAAPTNMVNALQVGPSFGESTPIWRVATVMPGGTRVEPAMPFAVCLGAAYSSAIRVETSNCVQATANLAVDCTCDPNEIAIAGGAYSDDPSYALNASQAGPSFGESAQVWRVA
jgi:hypothetical protein